MRRSAFFFGGWDILRGRRSTLAKEVLVHLLDDHFLIFPACRIQPILVEQHFAEFDPGVPGFLGNVVVDFPAQIIVEWRFFQSGKVLLQLYAENLMF